MSVSSQNGLTALDVTEATVEDPTRRSDDRYLWIYYKDYEGVIKILSGYVEEPTTSHSHSVSVYISIV